jgi:signal peptidase II
MVRFAEGLRMSDPGPIEGPPDRAPPRLRLRKTGLVVALIAACLGCDQATKRVAAALLPEGTRVSLLGDAVRLERIRNPGAFLGLGAGLPPRVRVGIFTWGVGLLVLGALVTAFHRRASGRTAVAAALVAAGGLGNLWDRATAGGLVTDFLNLGIGGLRTGVFNVADLAIVAGVLLALVGRGSPETPGR